MRGLQVVTVLLLFRVGSADVLNAAGKTAALANHNQHRRELAQGKEKRADGSAMPPATNMVKLVSSAGL